MPAPQDIKQRIEAALPGATVEVEDHDRDRRPLPARPSPADAFEGLSRIEQHKLVYGAVEADLGGAIHALALKTVVPSTIETP